MNGPLPRSFGVGTNDPRCSISFPRAQSAVRIAPGISIHTPETPPIWWWRMWHWILLGWTWEKL